jgi:hypothetical protein
VVLPGEDLSDAAARSAFGQGVASALRALYSRCVTLVLVEVGVANGCFLVHAPRPLVEASIEMAEQLAPSRGSRHGIMAAA